MLRNLIRTQLSTTRFINRLKTDEVLKEKSDILWTLLTLNELTKALFLCKKCQSPTSKMWRTSLKYFLTWNLPKGHFTPEWQNDWQFSSRPSIVLTFYKSGRPYPFGGCTLSTSPISDQRADFAFSSKVLSDARLCTNVLFYLTKRKYEDNIYDSTKFSKVIFVCNFFIFWNCTQKWGKRAS